MAALPFRYVKTYIVKPSRKAAAKAAASSNADGEAGTTDGADDSDDDSSDDEGDESYDESTAREERVGSKRKRQQRSGAHLIALPRMHGTLLSSSDTS